MDTFVSQRWKPGQEPVPISHLKQTNEFLAIKEHKNDNASSEKLSTLNETDGPGLSINLLVNLKLVNS